jgi:hypothetical protein
MSRMRDISVEGEAGSNHAHAHDLARPVQITKSDNVSLLPVIASCLTRQIVRIRTICLPSL